MKKLYIRTHFVITDIITMPYAESWMCTFQYKQAIMNAFMAVFANSKKRQEGVPAAALNPGKQELDPGSKPGMTRKEAGMTRYECPDFVGINRDSEPDLLLMTPGNR